jgi:hypothetical protein
MIDQDKLLWINSYHLSHTDYVVYDFLTDVILFSTFNNENDTASLLKRSAKWKHIKSDEVNEYFIGHLFGEDSNEFLSPSIFIFNKLTLETTSIDLGVNSLTQYWKVFYFSTGGAIFILDEFLNSLHLVSLIDFSVLSINDINIFHTREDNSFHEDVSQDIIRFSLAEGLLLKSKYLIISKMIIVDVENFQPTISLGYEQPIN